jgi:hypothetical protein
MSALTPPPTAPSTSDPATFAARSDALVAWLGTHVSEENALIAALAGSYTGASATSLTPSIASKALTATVGLAYQIGQPVMLASAATPAVWMSGPVTAYNSTTGAMTVNVTAVGTASAKADWIISLVPVGFTPGQLQGTATNDNAAAGLVGEYIESVIVSGSAVSLVNATAKNVTSISLTAGDWDVQGNICFSVSAGATLGGLSTGASLTTNAHDAQTDTQTVNVASVVGAGANLVAPYRRISIAVTTTVYLVALANFSGGTAAAFGALKARRAR